MLHVGAWPWWQHTPPPKMPFPSGHWPLRGCWGLLRPSHAPQEVMTACHFFPPWCKIWYLDVLIFLPRTEKASTKTSTKFSLHTMYHYVTAKLLLALGGSSSALWCECVFRAVKIVSTGFLLLSPHKLYTVSSSFCIVSQVLGMICFLTELLEMIHTCDKQWLHYINSRSECREESVSFCC